MEYSNRKIQIVQTEHDILEISLRKSVLFHELHDEKNWYPKYLSDEVLMQLKKQIDATYNNFTGHLHAVYPKITTQELWVCYLVKIEIPVRGIARYINRGVSAVTNIRKRLYYKIFHTEGSAKEFDKYISEL